MTTTDHKWLVRKARCACHQGQWITRLPGAEYQLFNAHALALAYAVDPQFRNRWKAGLDLARQYPIPLTAAMKGLGL